MRTSNPRVLLLLCVILCCCVQQCHFLGFTTLLTMRILGNMLGSGLGTTMAVTQAMGMSMLHSAMQSLFTTFAHGFSTMHTMVMALISGFTMGIMALTGFIVFLLAVVPPEEVRSLGSRSFSSPPLLPYVHNINDSRGFGLIARHRRSLVINSSIPLNVQNNSFHLPIPTQPGEQDGRIPRFLTRLVKRDPLNCLPLVMCGLSAAKKPNERTEVLNDYAYLMKEFISSSKEDVDSPEDVDSAEDGLRRRLPEEKAPLTWRDHLGNLFVLPKKVKKKDKVDQIVEEMEKEEDDKLEDLVLTDMASDPDDLTFALKDMKVRGLKKTMAKMPEQSKKEYISKLMGESGEEERYDPEDDYSMERRPGPGRDSEEEYDEGSVPRQYGRQEYPDSASGEDERVYYDSRELVRGGYPPAPPIPPNPLYSGEGMEEDQLYKRNLKILDQNLAAADFHRRRMGQRRQRNMGAGADRGYLQQKRNEAAEAKNVFDKTRVAAEIGAETRSSRQCRAFFRECPVKTLAKAPTTAAGETEGESADTQPFLNRAVNNIRRVLLGSPQGGTKQKRVNEIKEAIQQLNPPRNHGGSEVKVVLNIGPTPPDLHRAGVVMQPYGQPDPMALNGLVSPGIMAPHGPPSPGIVNVMMPNGQLSTLPQPYVPMNPPGPTQLYPASSSMPPPPPRFSSSIPPRFSSSPPPPSKLPPVKPTTFHDMLTSSIAPVKSTSPRPTTPSTRKTMVYHNPSSTKATKTSSPTPKISSPPSVELDNLEQMLKTTLAPEFEEITTNFPPVFLAEEEDEREETLDDLLPSKRPVTKDEYAQNLRETLNIFDRFKQAHQPKPTTAKPTPKPAAVAQKSHTSTKKASSNRIPSSNRPQKHGATGTRGKVAPKRPSNSKGETEDVPQEDIYEIIDFIKLLRKRNRNNKSKKKANKGKGGKGKGHKKGGDDDSSEESSEEDYYSQGPIVAVPPPTDRFKVMWKSSSSLLKDGFYHLLFSNKRAKPLPIPVLHHQPPVSVHVDDHDYHDEHSEHDEPPQGDEPHDDEPHEDDERPKDDEPTEDDEHHKDDEHDDDDERHKDDEVTEDDDRHKDEEPAEDDERHKDNEPAEDYEPGEDDKASEDDEPLEDDDSPEEDEPPEENSKTKSKGAQAKGSKKKQKKASPKKRTRPYHRPGRSGSKKKAKKNSSKLLIAIPDGAPSFKMSQPEPSMFPDEFNEEFVPHKYYDSVESSSYEAPSGESTEPELVYSPFSASRYKPKSTSKSISKGRRISSGRRSKVKKKRKGNVKRIGEVSSKATTSTTTTAKPKRRVLKYRG